MAEVRPPGTRIRYFGDYEILEEIAQGGMGIVYKARQLSLSRVVALKMIRSGQLASPTEVERFHREAEAAANLQHPNIVAIHEVGEHDGQHYFSMDFVEGQSLTQLIGGSPQPASQSATYVQTIAQAIDYAHQRGVLHRDLGCLDRHSSTHASETKQKRRQSIAGQKMDCLLIRLQLRRRRPNVVGCHVGTRRVHIHTRGTCQSIAWTTDSQQVAVALATESQTLLPSAPTGCESPRVTVMEP